MITNISYNFKIPYTLYAFFLLTGTYIVNQSFYTLTSNYHRYQCPNNLSRYILQIREIYYRIIDINHTLITR